MQRIQEASQEHLSPAQNPLNSTTTCREQSFLSIEISKLIPNQVVLPKCQAPLRQRSHRCIWWHNSNHDIHQRLTIRCEQNPQRQTYWEYWISYKWDKQGLLTLSHSNLPEVENRDTVGNPALSGQRQVTIPWINLQLYELFVTNMNGSSSAEPLFILTAASAVTSSDVRPATAKIWKLQWSCRQESGRP